MSRTAAPCLDKVGGCSMGEGIIWCVWFSTRPGQQWGSFPDMTTRRDEKYTKPTTCKNFERTGKFLAKVEE